METLVHYEDDMGPKKELSHIASGLFPTASFIAVPSTPVPEPESKNKPHLKPSPLYGALVGASNLSRSFGGLNPVDGMARSVSSNPLYASIESRGIDDRDFDNEDDRPVRDYATELKRDEDDADDDYDADPGYTTVGSESASSLGPFLPRQRLLTPPSPLREDDDDFDENDDVDDNEDASRSETHVKKGIDQPGIRRKKTDPSLNSPANSLPPLKPRSQSQPIYSMPQKLRSKKEALSQGLAISPIRNVVDEPLEHRNRGSPAFLTSTRQEDESSPLRRELDDLRKENAQLKQAAERAALENADLKRAALDFVESRQQQQESLDRAQSRPSQQRLSPRDDSLKGGPDPQTQRTAIEALRDLTDSLQNQNRDLDMRNVSLNEEIARLRHSLAIKESEREQAISGAIHEEQNKEMRKEIRSLQTTIQRLSVELSQAQIYSDSLVQRDDAEGPIGPLRNEGPCPSWLVNTKYLSPLIAAYDEKLQEKDKTLNQCRHELEEFRSKMGSLSEENSVWQKKLETVQEKERNRLNKEWTILENHNQLLIRENQILMSQIGLKEQKMTSLVESSVETEARHSLRENQLEAELGAKESEVTSLAERLAGLKEKHDAVIAADEGKMSIEEHVQQLQDLKKLVNDLKDNHLREKESLVSSQRVIDEENRDLRSSFAAAVDDSEAKEKRILEAEKENRKLGKKIAALVAKLIAGKKLQEETEDRLEDVCVALEKCRSDNLALSSLVEAESEQRNQVMDQVLQRSANIGHMEEKLLNYRNKVGDKLVANASKMQKLDITYTQHRIEYRKRISQLLKLVEKKDRQLLRLMAAVKEELGGTTDDFDDISDDLEGDVQLYSDME